MAKAKSSAQQDIKAALKVLKKKGLYSGDLRKAPTSYAKRLTRRYSDVVSGSAHVISVPRHETKRDKGVVVARTEAKSLAEAYGLAVRAKGHHLIVNTVSAGDKVIYSPKKKLLEIERARGSDYVERIELRKHMELQQQRDGTLELGIRALKDGESYVVPFNRGNGQIQYLYFADKDALLAMLNQYGADRVDTRYNRRERKSKKGAKYNPVIKGWNAADYVSIARLKKAPRKRAK